MKFIVVFMKYLYITFHIPCLFVNYLSSSHISLHILHSSVISMRYTKVPKKFYSFRSSFHVETCESPTLSGVVTAPNSETLVADVLSFLTVGKGVLCQRWTSGLKVFNLSSVRKNTVRPTGVVQPFYFWKRKGI